MGSSLFRQSRLVSGITLLSRLTGLLRDVILAYWLGNNWIQDSFKYAFRIPNLFRSLLGEGALAAAFVPVLSEKLTAGDRSATQRLLSTVATLLAVLLAVLTLAVLGIVAVLYAADPADGHRRLILLLTALMAPYMILVCLVALFAAVLNCLDRFALAAFMPVLLNVFQIAALAAAPTLLAGVLPEQSDQIFVVGFSVLAAGVAQLALMLRALKRQGWRWGWRFDVRAAEVRRIALTAAPMIVGLGILQFGAWLDDTIIVKLTATEGQSGFELLGRTIAYPFAEGTLSSVDQARRLYQFPLGVLAIALATVAFPTFSRYAANKDYGALAGSVRSALRLALFEGIPSGVGLLVLSELIVRVVFMRGNYTAANTAATAHVLRFYSLGIWAYCSQHIILRAFYSLGDTVTPLWVMARTLAVAVAMNVTLLWVEGLGAGVFGLSTAVMVGLNVVILGRRLGRRLGALDVGDVLWSAGKTLTASVAMGLAVYAGREHLPIENKYLLLLACVGIGLAVFFAAALALRQREAWEMLRLRRR